MGKRSSFPRRKNDAYDTPFKAVMPVIPHLIADGIKRFVEPCCGDGFLVEHLERFGLGCAYQNDIKAGADALSLTPAQFDRLGADAIVTNPPWTREIMHPLIDHFQRLAPTWLLFDADWAHTRQAAGYLEHCSKIVSVGRVKWMPDSKHYGKDNAAWYRFDIRHTEGPLFIGLPQYRLITLAEIAAEPC